MDNKMLWDAFLTKVQIRLENQLAFDTWFLETKLLSIDNGITSVLVPTTVHIRYLNTVYLTMMEELFNEVFNTNTIFKFVVENEYKDDINNVVEVTQIDTARDYYTSNLNSMYTFDNFVVGESNRVAASVAVAVAEQPGKQYNPLFIYGKSGLGKTHLMQAIGNHILKTSRDIVIYVSANTFLEDFVDGLNKKDVNLFKNKYRNVDVLIIDDIQFLANADKTQEEFFHTFNILHQNNKQIIISSDRSPDDLKVLEDRLRTRFNWGISVNINPPELQLRKQILKSKLKALNVDMIIDDEVIDYIAHRANQDVRELEGTLRSLLATASIIGNGTPINLEFAIDCLKDASSIKRNNRNDVSGIINAVASTYGVSSDEIRGNSRKQEINFPRQVAMFISRDVTDLSFQKIGLQFGNKHHSTVMSSCAKIRKLSMEDEYLSALIFKIKELL